MWRRHLLKAQFSAIRAFDERYQLPILSPANIVFGILTLMAPSGQTNRTGNLASSCSHVSLASVPRQVVRPSL